MLSPAERLPILVVDDRRDNLVALEAVLAPLGLGVVTATSGEEALRLLLERDFALVLLDVRMPGIDGIETARMIKSRERTAEVPIVFLTAARDEVSSIVRGYDVGAVDYVLKPFDEELLRSKVAVFAELEHRRRALRHSESFLRSAFEAAPIGKTLLDTSWRIVRANPAFARMLGADQQNLVGTSITELCHPEDREALTRLLETAAESDADHGDDLGADLRLVTEDRPELWVAPTASRIKGSELMTPLALVQWVDVSGRRRGEQARADLLLEHAARAQAEAQAERLERLQRLVAALEPRSLDDLLAELARRLVTMFAVDAAEVRLDDGGGGQPIHRTSAAHAPRPDGDLLEPDGGRWEEATLEDDGVRIGALRIAQAVDRSFSAGERALLRDAAEHVSLMVRRMQLHEREHRIAVELQRGLLPDRLPQVPGLAIAAHSQAAGLAAEVGGDWYDTFVLPGSRLGVVIGDVTGSGIGAASVMGQLRSVTRAFALDDSAPASPADVLRRLHRYHQQVGLRELFTILYLILDRVEGTLVWSNAGHPPPLLRLSGGEVQTLAGGQTLMSLKDVDYENQQVRVGEGDTVIVYTDGLVERRGESIDDGVARLATAAGDGPEGVEELCLHLLESARDAGVRNDDDLTALVVAVTGEDAGREDPDVADKRIQVTLPRDVKAPAMARRIVEDTFAAGLDDDELERATLAVSELTTNAVVHGRGEITMFADIDASRLLIEVIDQGSGFEYQLREQDFEQVGGRGLGVVDAVTSRWGMHEGTTHVWFEIERSGPRVGADQRPPLAPIQP